MDHPLGMSVRERIGDVGDDSRRFPEVRSVFLELRKQVLAAEQRGDDVAIFAFHTGIEYGDDSRMLQSGKLTGLLDEGFVAVRGVHPRCVQDLDRDRTLELGIETLVHGREAASSDRAANLIASEPSRPRRAWRFPSRRSGVHGALRSQSARRRETI